MFLFRKNIILVPSDYDGISITKGLISLDAYSGKTICNLHCYNLDFEKPLLLGIAINKRLFKVKIEKNQQKNTNFDLDIEIKNDDEISCVLLDVKQDDYSIVLWGSTQINKSWQSMLELMIEDQKIASKVQNQSCENASSNAKTNGVNNHDSQIDGDFASFGDDGTMPNFENIDKKQQKNSFYEQNFDEKQQNFQEAQLDDYIDKVIELSESQDDLNQPEGDKNLDVIDEPDNFQKERQPNFYDRISPQINKMFAENNEEKVLSEILPNSKFCRVDFDDRDGYYVFGIIYERGAPKYLCYGLPAKKDSKPPIHLSDYYQWLPVDAQDENGDGFYMMYQDADTGKNISVEVI